MVWTIMMAYGLPPRPEHAQQQWQQQTIIILMQVLDQYYCCMCNLILCVGGKKRRQNGHLWLSIRGCNQLQVWNYRPAYNCCRQLLNPGECCGRSKFWWTIAPCDVDYHSWPGCMHLACSCTWPCYWLYEKCIRNVYIVGCIAVLI